jgi:hypothetical protein
MNMFMDRLLSLMDNLQKNETAVRNVANAFVFLGETIMNALEFAGEVIGTFVFYATEQFEILKALLSLDFDEAMRLTKESVTLTFDSLKTSWEELSDKTANAAKRIKESGKKLVEADKTTKIGIVNNTKIQNKLALDEEKKKQKEEEKIDEQKLKRQEAHSKKVQDFVKEQGRKRVSIQEQFVQQMKVLEYEAATNKLQTTMMMMSQSSVLMSSGNKTLFNIGKAMAIADAVVNVARGIAQAWGLGPILGPPMAALVAAGGYVQIQKIRSTNLAEGGVIMPKVGGTLANIGEAGKPEAVIPLDEAEGAGIGLGNNIVVNINAGTMVADDEGISKLAEMLDEKFFDMQVNKESVTF